jgi:hypothetical protein
MKVESSTKDIIERKLKLDSIQKFLKAKESMKKSISISSLSKHPYDHKGNIFS